MMENGAWHPEPDVQDRKMKAETGKSTEPSVGENKNLELRKQRGGGMSVAGGQRERGGESFITVDGGSVLRAAGAGGNIDIFIFPLNLIFVMDELPVL